MTTAASSVEAARTPSGERHATRAASHPDDIGARVVRRPPQRRRIADADAALDEDHADRMPVTRRLHPEPAHADCRAGNRRHAR